MASGRLAAVDMPAGVNTLIYQGPGGRADFVDIGICNRNETDVRIRLALTDISGELNDSDYLEYDTVLRANGVIEREGVTLAGKQALIGYSDAANVSFAVWA